MKESVAQLLNALSNVLAEDVLPELNVRAWEASRVRSVLMLLQYCEDRVLHESTVLTTGNRLMRAFFANVRTDAVSAQLGPAAGALLAEVADAADGRGSYAHPDPETASKALKALLCRLIRAAGEDRRHSGATDTAFRSHLHALLREIQRTEQTLFAKASLLLPM